MLSQKIFRLAALMLPLVAGSMAAAAPAAKSAGAASPFIIGDAGQVVDINTSDTSATTSSDPFLAQNKLKPGVVTLSDGLQYKILEKGSGPRPTLTDTVTVDYAGRLPDGSEFDSSYKRGQPAKFPVSGVIAGWTEALQLMPVGSTWELYIPADLAYGENGAPPSIGPNQTLIFKVKLISIDKG